MSIHAGDIDSKEVMPVRWGRRVMSGIWCKVGRKEDMETSDSSSTAPKITTKVEPFLTRVPRNISSSTPASEKSSAQPTGGSSSTNKKQTSSSKDGPSTEKRPSLGERRSTLSRFLPESRRNSLVSEDVQNTKSLASSVKEPKLNRSSTTPLPKSNIVPAVQPPPFSDDGTQFYSVPDVSPRTDARG